MTTTETEILQCLVRHYGILDVLKAISNPSPETPEIIVDTNEPIVWTVTDEFSPTLSETKKYKSPRKRSRRLGRPSVLTPKTLDRIRQLRILGVSGYKIAKQLKLADSTVYAAIKKLAL